MNKIKQKVIKEIEKSSFETNRITSILLNPFHIARRELLHAIKANSSIISGKVIDIGCGSDLAPKFAAK